MSIFRLGPLFLPQIGPLYLG